jgi:peroxiredoxin
LKRFAEDLKTSIPLLSDHMRNVSKTYGTLIEAVGISNRATFLVDMEGKIVHIEEGSSAINPEGALMACERIKKK